jgi:hypothetical protein
MWGCSDCAAGKPYEGEVQYVGTKTGGYPQMVRVLVQGEDAGSASNRDTEVYIMMAQYQQGRNTQKICIPKETACNLRSLSVSRTAVKAAKG